MVGPVSDLSTMLAGLDPALSDQAYTFVLVTPDDAPKLLGAAIATFREGEGVTAVVPAELANELEIAAPAFAHIILQVHSDLEAVGLTAAVSSALADAGIACNVIAAFHHDHIFVPWAARKRTMEVLRSLADDAG